MITSFIHKTGSIQLSLIYLKPIEKVLFLDLVYPFSLTLINRPAVGGWQKIRMDILTPIYALCPT